MIKSDKKNVGGEESGAPDDAPIIFAVFLCWQIWLAIFIMDPPNPLHAAVSLTQFCFLIKIKNYIFNYVFLPKRDKDNYLPIGFVFICV